MPTNPFFNNFGASNEQIVLEDLIIECIKQYGQDMYYLPRHLNNFDNLYGQDDISSYEHAYTIEIYIRSTDGFEGDGNLISQFGLEIRDRIVFTIANKSFQNYVGQYADITRPREGDLIYFPLNKKAFEIKFVENKPYFYQLGILPMYDVYVELWEYSHETVNTGIDEIDTIQHNFDLNILPYALKTENGEPLVTETGDYIMSQVVDQTTISVGENNDNIQQEANSIIIWTDIDPFSDGNV